MAKRFDNIKHVLLDIEGTIVPITFTKDTLFPYALKSLPSVLQSKWNDLEFQRYRAAFPETAHASPEAFEAHFRNLTEQNATHSYFKDLQGYLFEEGYRNGAYATPLFSDVPLHLREWDQASVKVSVYSAGSVFAQKLLFQFVNVNTPDHPKETGDLRGSVSHWFDTTTVGPKAEAGSYESILKVLEAKPEEVLFFSDNMAELIAANGQGVKVSLVDRPGNPPLDLSEEARKKFAVIKSFDEIELSGPSKAEHTIVNGSAGGPEAGHLVDGSASEKKRDVPHDEDTNGRQNVQKEAVAASKPVNESGESSQPPPKKRKTVKSKPQTEDNLPTRRSQRLRSMKS